MEHSCRLNAFDDFLLRRAATQVTLELAGSRRATADAADARAGLARQLIRGTAAEEDLRRTSEYLGIDLDGPRSVVYLRPRDPEALITADTERMIEELGGLLHAEVLETKGQTGSRCSSPYRPDEPGPVAVRRLTAALTEVMETADPAGDLIAGVSTVCRTAARCPRGIPRGGRGDLVHRDLPRCVGPAAAGGGRPRPGPAIPRQRQGCRRESLR